MKVTLTVEGMHCNSCKMLIEDELAELGVKDIVVTLDPSKTKGTVSCETDDKKSIIEAIEGLGEYRVKG